MLFREILIFHYNVVIQQHTNFRWHRLFACICPQQDAPSMECSFLDPSQFWGTFPVCSRRGSQNLNRINSNGSFLCAINISSYAIVNNENGLLSTCSTHSCWTINCECNLPGLKLQSEIWLDLGKSDILQIPLIKNLCYSIQLQTSFHTISRLHLSTAQYEFTTQNYYSSCLRLATNFPQLFTHQWMGSWNNPVSIYNVQVTSLLSMSFTTAPSVGYWYSALLHSH